MGKLKWGMRACGVLMLWAATAIALPAQTFTTLHSFDQTDGEYPQGMLVQGTDGKLYGTAESGGAGGYGTIFSITSGGMLTTLDSFNGTDGFGPTAGLVQGTDGKFYGTTPFGGIYSSGTVFSITATGILTTLHTFDGTDGVSPYGGLVQGADGKFYGTTFSGGANINYGTVFALTPEGSLTTIYSFCSPVGCLHGQNPYSGLIQGTDGKFYGTTSAGGANSPHGTVFSITTDGALTTLYSFCSQVNCTDGDTPMAGLVQGADGDFYGTTLLGGAHINGDNCSPYGCGTIFRITPSGKFSVIHAFCNNHGGNCPDGKQPYAGLTRGTDGNLYGATVAGGANNCESGSCGTIFAIAPGGTLATLHSFNGTGTDGAYPEAGLIQGTNGMFYGTTAFGGASGDGTIFSISVGLGPFVETNPASGSVGAAVTILGTNLTGATKVTFHGTLATFTVVSSSEITTMVPTGATNGLVKVVTPSATLSSNVPFRVLP